MCVVGHVNGDWLVDCQWRWLLVCVRDKAGVGHMSRDAGAPPECEVETQTASTSSCAALCRVEQKWAGLPGRALAWAPQEGSGSLSMKPVGCTPLCFSDTSDAAAVACLS